MPSGKYSPDNDDNFLLSDGLMNPMTSPQGLLSPPSAQQHAHPHGGQNPASSTAQQQTNPSVESGRNSIQQMRLKTKDSLSMQNIAAENPL